MKSLSIQVPALYQNRPGLVLAFAILVHVVLWTLLPTLFFDNAPVDVIEIINWGHNPQLGYTKHPPLPAWITWLVFDFLGSGITGIYLISQLHVAATLIFAYLLASNIIGKNPALISTALLWGVFYYSIPTPEYNHNIAQMPFWAGAIYFYYRACFMRRDVAWLACGFCLVAVGYAKYSGILLVFTLLAHLLFTKNGRDAWRNPYFWGGIVLSILLFLPHLNWLIENEFVPFTYALDQDGAKNIIDHFIFPAKFLGAQILDHAGMLVLILVILKWPSKAPTFRESKSITKDQKVFIWLIAIGPLMLSLVLSFLLGLKFKTMWGAPMFTFSGLLAMVCLGHQIRIQNVKAVSVIWIALIVLPPIGVAISTWIAPVLRQKGSRVIYPGKAIAQIVNANWREGMGTKLEYVIGDYWTAGNVGVYAPDRPLVYSGDPIENSWIDLARLRKSGGIIVWDQRFGEAMPSNLRQQFPNFEPGGQIQIPWGRPGLESSPVSLKWAWLRPLKNRESD